MATREFTFVLDRDGTLCRWDQWYVSDVWWPKAGVWHGYPMNPFTANVTVITPERAQELAGPGADLYANTDQDLEPAPA